MQRYFWLRKIAPRPLSAAALIACGVFLGACSGTSKPDPTPNPNILPADYRDEIIDAIRRSDDDPVGIRDAFIAPPALRPSGNETRYIVCLRYNAKKERSKVYAGVKEVAAVYYAGKLTAMLPATKEQCTGAPYQPFTELEKLCREVVCPGTR